jgi:hypothetical protein
MKSWKGLAGVAMVMLALGGVALADDTGNGTIDNGTSGGETAAPAAAPTETPAPSGPLMNLLDMAHLSGPLDAANINIFGHVEAGYLYDYTNPTNLTPAKTAPGDFIFFPGPYKDTLMLNQLDLTIERAVDINKDSWDFGFLLEGMYGRDAFYTHSNGMLDQDNKNGGASGPDDQFDLPQGYLTMVIPVLSGIEVKAGKMADLLGIETINPTNNVFYTHSYIFSYGTPFTQTGVLGTINLPSQTSTTEYSLMTFGITRGWNQSTSDNNGVPDGYFQFATHGDWLSYAFNLSYGPEGVLAYGPPDNADWWVVPEANITVKASDNLTISGDGLLGNATHLATWGGIAGYITYTLDPRWSFSGRIEFYQDGHGVTTGVGGAGAVDYGEATFGVGITPVPGDEWFGGLVIRPEIRYDWADRPVFDATTSNQLTSAIDVYWKF